MSQNVVKCPLQTHRCPNGLVSISPVASMKLNWRHFPQSSVDASLQSREQIKVQKRQNHLKLNKQNSITTRFREMKKITNISNCSSTQNTSCSNNKSRHHNNNTTALTTTTASAATTSTTTASGYNNNNNTEHNFKWPAPRDLRTGRWILESWRIRLPDQPWGRRRKRRRTESSLPEASSKSDPRSPISLTLLAPWSMRERMNESVKVALKTITKTTTTTTKTTTKSGQYIGVHDRIPYYSVATLSIGE